MGVPALPPDDAAPPETRGVITTVSDSQHTILRNIATLYCGGAFEVDATYSTGHFYQHGVPPPRRLTTDTQTKGPSRCPLDGPAYHGGRLQRCGTSVPATRGR